MAFKLQLKMNRYNDTHFDYEALQSTLTLNVQTRREQRGNYLVRYIEKLIRRELVNKIPILNGLFQRKSSAELSRV